MSARGRDPQMTDDELYQEVSTADSWAGRAIRAWRDRAGADGDPVAVDCDDRDALVRRLEDDAGAPETPGWD